jgi:hypothetical protein
MEKIMARRHGKDDEDIGNTPQEPKSVEERVYHVYCKDAKGCYGSVKAKSFPLACKKLFTVNPAFNASVLTLSGNILYDGESPKLKKMNKKKE